MKIPVLSKLLSRGNGDRYQELDSDTAKAVLDIRHIHPDDIPTLDALRIDRTTGAVVDKKKKEVVFASAKLLRKSINEIEAAKATRRPDTLERTRGA